MDYRKVHKEMIILKKRTFIIGSSIIIIIFLLFVIISKPGGFRGGNAFQDSTVKAMEKYCESNVSAEPLFEEQKCNDKIYIQAFWLKETETIHCATFEEKNNKYTYLYGFDFKPDEITEKSGLEVFDVYNKCEVVYGIMPGEKNKVMINEKIPSTTVSFVIDNSKYKCWYALVDGGYDAVKNVSYS